MIPAPAVLSALLLLVPVILGGCGGSQGRGALEARSAGPAGIVLTADFPTVCYRPGSDDQVSIVLSDVPLESLLDGSARNGQILGVDLLWTPRPGETPLDPSATNVTIRYIVMSGGEVGLYEGGGFALVAGTPGSRSLTLSLEESSLRLRESTAGFVDLLSPGSLTGTIAARRHDEKTHRFRLAASQFITNRFGRTAYVRADRPAGP